MFFIFKKIKDFFETCKILFQRVELELSETAQNLNFCKCIVK